MHGAAAAAATSSLPKALKGVWGGCGPITIYAGQKYRAISNAEIFFEHNRERGLENAWVRIFCTDDDANPKPGWANLLTLLDDKWLEYARSEGMITDRTVEARAASDGLRSVCQALIGLKPYRKEIVDRFDKERRTQGLHTPSEAPVVRMLTNSATPIVPPLAEVASRDVGRVPQSA